MVNDEVNEMNEQAKVNKEFEAWWKGYWNPEKEIACFEETFKTFAQEVWDAAQRKGFPTVDRAFKASN